MQQYDVISADSHVNEPPDLWVERIEPQYRDRAPRVVKDDRGGDAWSFEGRRASLGLDAMADRRPEEWRPAGVSYAEIRVGSYDPVERLKDMDLDGIDADVLYPGAGTRLYLSDDIGLAAACLRVYNDWLAQLCATDPRRLAGIGLVPIEEMQLATGELRRIGSLGLRGAMAPTYTRSKPYNDPAYDPFWAEAQESGLPVHFHLRTGGKRNPLQWRGGWQAHSTMGALALYETLALLIWSGVLERFPRLRVVSVEGNIGWIGYFLQKADDVYRSHRHWAKPGLTLLPSEYFHRQVYATFIEDKVGLMVRHVIGVDNIMWSSDYPHSNTTWPNSRQAIQEQLRGVPEDEKRKIVAGNAARLYRFV